MTIAALVALLFCSLIAGPSSAVIVFSALSQHRHFTVHFSIRKYNWSEAQQVCNQTFEAAFSPSELLPLPLPEERQLEAALTGAPLKYVHSAWLVGEGEDRAANPPSCLIVEVRCGRVSYGPLGVEGCESKRIGLTTETDRSCPSRRRTGVVCHQVTGSIGASSDDNDIRTLTAPSTSSATAVAHSVTFPARRTSPTVLVARDTEVNTIDRISLLAFASGLIWKRLLSMDTYVLGAVGGSALAIFVIGNVIVILFCITPDTKMKYNVAGMKSTSKATPNEDPAAGVPLTLGCYAERQPALCTTVAAEGGESLSLCGSVGLTEL